MGEGQGHVQGHGQGLGQGQGHKQGQRHGQGDEWHNLFETTTCTCYSHTEEHVYSMFGLTV